MVDAKLTTDIQNWLNSPKKNIFEGAELLVRINRNRMMYQYILRKHDMGKLTYELRKHLKIRQDGSTRRDVVLLEQKVMPEVQESLASNAIQEDNETDEDDKVKYHGKREDHDELPDSVRNLYGKNGTIFCKMKELYNTLLQMEDAEPCDRYEHLKILADLDTKYRENWNAYDSWKREDAAAKVEVTPKTVSAARKYISDNKKKLSELPEEKKEMLLQKMQERISFLVAAGETFDADYQTELESYGLLFS